MVTIHVFSEPLPVPPALPRSSPWRCRDRPADGIGACPVGQSDGKPLPREQLQYILSSMWMFVYFIKHYCLLMSIDFLCLFTEVNLRLLKRMVNPVIGAEVKRRSRYRGPVGHFDGDLLNSEPLPVPSGSLTGNPW